MDRNQAKEFYPILQAYAEGKVIECRTKPSFIEGTDVLNDWAEMREIVFWNNTDYRIKPEQKYRQFANAEECFAEMLNHHPFAWIKSIDNKDSEVFIHCTAITKKDGILTGIDEIPFPYCGMFNNYTFADGTPFGIKEEE